MPSTATMVPGIAEKSGGVTNTVLTDRMGSTKAMASSGASTFTADYDAFGKVASTSGTTTTQKGFVGNSGYQEDGESGYKLLGHRYYEPDSGRFLSMDPAFVGRNWFAYCENNPLKAIDATGLSFKWIGSGIAIRLVQLESQFPWLAARLMALLGWSSSQVQQYAQPVETITEDVQAASPQPALVTAAEEVASQAEQVIGESGGAAGTLKHQITYDGLRDMGYQFRNEISFKDGVEVKYGTPGSIRVDVVQDDINLVLDLKFGNAALSLARELQIRGHLPGGGEGWDITGVSPWKMRI